MAKAVLVVDDSITIRKLVGNLLTKLGYEIHEAANGKEGLAKVDRVLSLIITDINMPVMDGIDFIRAVREHGNHKFTPILCLTTETEAAKKEQGREAGATGWVLKPFDADRLLKAIQKVVA